MYPLRWPESQWKLCWKCAFRFFFFFPPPTHTPVNLSLLGQTLVYLVGLFPVHSVNCLLAVVLARPLAFLRPPVEERLVSHGKELMWLGVGLTLAVAHDKQLLRYSQMRTGVSEVFTAHFEPAHFTCGWFFFFSSNYWILAKGHKSKASISETVCFRIQRRHCGYWVTGAVLEPPNTPDCSMKRVRSLMKTNCRRRLLGALLCVSPLRRRVSGGGRWLLLLWVSSSCSPCGKMLVGRSGVLFGPGTRGGCMWKGFTSGSWMLRKPSASSLEYLKIL